MPTRALSGGSLLLPHPAMATRLLCSVTLCLLGLGFSDAGVTQTLRHKVTKIGQEVTLSCKPISGHDSLYWYRQTLLQGLKLLIYFRNQAPIDEKGMPKDRFSAKMPNGSFSTLKIQPTEVGDSAMYLCASSLATALQSHSLPVQKPSCFPFSPQPSSAVSPGSPVSEHGPGFGVLPLPTEDKN